MSWGILVCAITGCGRDAAAAPPMPVDRPALLMAKCVTAPKWTPISTANAPASDGYLMADWVNGRLALTGPHGGAAFDPCANRWSKPIANAPALFDELGAMKGSLTAGDHVVAIYGNYGYANEMHALTAAADIFDVEANVFRRLPLSGPAAPARSGYASVWTGRDVIVWGGETMPKGWKPPPPPRSRFGDPIDDRKQPPTLMGVGFAFDPKTLKVRAIAKSPLSPRTEAEAVWTGSKMFVWGGLAKPYGLRIGANASDPLATGALYDPVTNTWSRVSTKEAPSARPFAHVQMVGSRVLVFSGQTGSLDGGLYDPATDRWERIPAPKAMGQYPSFAVVDEHIVVSGGGSAMAYDLTKATWKQMPALPSGAFWVDLGGFIDGRELEPGAIVLAKAQPRAGKWKTLQLPALELPGKAVPKIMRWHANRLIAWGEMVKVADQDEVCFSCRGNVRARGVMIDAPLE